MMTTLRFTAIIAVITLVAGACGQGVSGGAGEPGDIDAPERAIGLLPADWVNYSLTDVGRLMDEGQGAYADEFEDSWGDTLDRVGILIDEVAVLAEASGQLDEHVLVLQGRFDFDAVRDELSDFGMEEGEYRGFELWEGDGLSRASEVALIEDGGFVLIGSGGATTVLRGLSREVGLLEYEDESGVHDLLSLVGDGWHRQVRAGEDCLHIGVQRCEGVAWSVTRSERERELGVTWAFAFRDERSANRELDSVEALFDDVAILDVRSSRADGRLIVLSGTLDEKDWRHDGLTWASMHLVEPADTIPAPLAATPRPARAAPVPAAAPAPSPIGPQGPMVASIDQDSDSCIVVRFTEAVIAPPGLGLYFRGAGDLRLLNRHTDEQGRTPALELKFGKYDGTDNIAGGTVITSFVFWAGAGLIRDSDGNEVPHRFEPYTVPADITCTRTN